MLAWDPRSRAGGGKKGLALDEECDFDCPHSNRRRYGNPISVPNRNASNPNEHQIWVKLEVLLRTHT
jgi:hypothetical protein